ncbi:hypothetical protein ACTXT7_017283, partial [Hymenolepis weldensis]
MTAVLWSEKPARKPTMPYFQGIQLYLVHLHAPRRLATVTAMYVCDHGPNGTLVEGVNGARQDIMLNEFDFDSRTWVRLQNCLRPRYATRNSSSGYRL